MTEFNHADWLGLVEVSGPFLSLPVLRRTWPALDPIAKADRDAMRVEHARWQSDDGTRDAWVRFVLRDLLVWGDAAHFDELNHLAVEVPEHDTVITPTFALAVPEADPEPDAICLLGTITTGRPLARVPGSAWAASPADRLAHACRHHGVELGLATDGRWWTLVWAPRGGVTSTATFDAIGWTERSDRDVLRAFVSLLNADRFFAVPEGERLPALLHASADNQEDITDALGVQVRQAVELLVAAIGRAGVESGAHEVYRGAVAIMMRLVFLLFAEERRLLPSDNELYARAYSAGRLCAELEQRALEGSENELEYSTDAWHRLLALFSAVYSGVRHPRLTMHPHDGSLFDPDEHEWLPLTIDDRTVLHMLRAVQYVQVGTGRNRERRKLSFRTLDVEQIGYVYEGLLSFDGFRAVDVVVSMTGKAGKEEEVELSELERIGPDPTALAERFKESGIGTASVLTRRLAPLDEMGTLEATRKLLGATGGDADLTRRLLPYYGILREDLRGLPLVILPGALYVTESPLRKNTGTHYTPRFLAEEVVHGALEPLLYHVGPLQTADRSQWTPKSSAEILSLKVADIAMGSAAFLVAAARYLGDALVEAWAHEGSAEAVSYKANSDGRTADADADPVVVGARRQVIEHCLYGADINPMAVEMAKLSLWLVSMDPDKPFTFVDDRLVVGDSLLGITSVEQLEYMHLDPRRGRKLYKDTAVDFTADIRRLLGRAAAERRGLAEIPLGDDPRAALEQKHEILGKVEAETAEPRLVADLLVGASLAHAAEQGRLRPDHPVPDALDQGKARGFDAASLKASALANSAIPQAGESREKAEEQRREWLNTNLVPGNFDRQPIHWPLVFPEVFGEDRPGFDAIIGNPPFLGGTKITGPLGVAYRELLVEAIARGLRAGGRCDLVAYFVLRSHDLLSSAGQVGLVATNTLAQSDTREVGLDQLVVRGVTIRQAIKSKPWPSKSAALEYCAVWTSQAALEDMAERIADGVAVDEITTSLDPGSRIAGNPYMLAANAGRTFQGSKLDGIGFTMAPEAATAMIERDPRNKDVLFPYLNGQDLNSRPDCSGSRWVINFHDWGDDRAKTYPEPFDQVVRLVKPARATHGEKRTREAWWRFQRSRPELYAAIAGLERVVVIARISKTAMPVMVPTGQVLNEKVVVLTTDDTAMLALLSSAPHYWWAVKNSATLKADLQYAPSDVFETLPLPGLTQEMRDLGDRLDAFRREVMLSRQAGLTATYNLVNNPNNNDQDIAELRHIHRDIDAAICNAYHWNDLIDKLDHGHHPVARETRYTVGPAVQRELVDRLLELNHSRYAEEVARGLHAKKAGKFGRQKARAVPPEQETLL